MKLLILFATFLAYSPAVLAWPGLSLIRRGQVNTQKNATLCFPWPPRELKKAVPYNKKFPYLGARGSQVLGTGKGGILVPAKGDHDHAFHPPLPGAYRGPCPGLNVAANHGFLSRDGVSTYDELVEMGQNLWNFGYDASVALAAVGIAVDGDIKRNILSIGADASCTGQVDGGGLNLHDTFEADASLTRNDFYLSPVGDDSSLNATLWTEFVKLGQEMQNTTKPVFNRELIAAYKSVRSDNSKAKNSLFNRSPGSLIIYGAAGIVSDIFGGDGEPTYDKVRAIYGAEDDGEGGFIPTVNERLPPNWRNRLTPWTISGVAETISHIYLPYWKELGHYDGNGTWIPEKYQLPKDASPQVILCFLYDNLTNRGRGPPVLPHDTLKYITDRVNPHFAAAGCEILDVA